MFLQVLTILIFLVSFGLLVSAAYFFVQVPLAKQKLRVRLEAVQVPTLQGNADLDTELLRHELLSDNPFLNRVLASAPIIPGLQLFLQQAAVEMQVSVFLLIVISLVLSSWIVAILANLAFLVGVGLSIVAASLPFIVLAFKRKRRFRRFEELFPDAIDLLARAVRAGHAFTTAFSLIGEEMPEPLAQEFKLTYRQQNLGLPLRDALLNMSMRMPLPDVRIFISALQIQRESGGNLGEILDNLASVIRERFAIYREVEIVTAEGRYTMYVLTAMPFIGGLVMYMVNPVYMTPLFVDPFGHLMLEVGLIMIAFGYTIIRRMVNIKI
jgi:tight adherence protein B